MVEAAAPYPGGSKSRVTRAGAAVRVGAATADDLTCIDTWRAAHAPVINTFQAMLRNRARRASVVVGQRHKRKITIFGKLERLPKMELARMDDIAGCRLIFDSSQDMYAFRASLHGARFSHRLRNAVDKYDYVKKPKESGYRGIHDVYEYQVKSPSTSSSNGLFVELQYRTKIQHAWATANEIIGFVTESQPKFDKGDVRYREIMTITSEILARTYEFSRSCLPDLSDKEIVERFVNLDNELGFLGHLRGLNSRPEKTAKNTNVILMFKEGKPLEIKTFRYGPEALRNLFILEQENPGLDIVFVKGSSTEDVRIAFKNYFSDAREFISLVERGCDRMSGATIIRPRKRSRNASGRP